MSQSVILLFFSIASPKLNYHFGLISADWSPSFVDTRCFSIGIGTDRFIIGTSTFELRKFPIPSEWKGSGNSSVETLPLNIHLRLFNKEATNIYGYLGMNQWFIGTSYYQGGSECYAYNSYYYYRFGIGATIYSFLRINLGCFYGGFEGKEWWPPDTPHDTISLTNVKSNAFYVTVGAGLPDLWKEFKGISHPEFTSKNILLQGTGGVIGAYAGFFVGGVAVIGTIGLFHGLGGWEDMDIGRMWATIFLGGVPGACVGFPLGYWATGKLFHLDK